LLLDVPKPAWNPGLKRLLAQFQPAGVFFQRLTPASAEVCVKCRESVPAPFLAIEDEGGESLTDLFPGVPPLECLNAENAARAGELIARAMTMFGLNLNLAPTVDLPAGDTLSLKDGGQMRTTSAPKPLDVARRAEAFVRGLAHHGVLACARHFPGLPANREARLQPAPAVDKGMAILWREDLVPYRTVGATCAMVQITHAVHKAYDYEFPRPASLSPAVVEGLLRVKLGYRGVALADASAAARAAAIDVGDAAVKAVAAGCDLVLIPGDESRVRAVCSALQRAIELGILSRARVEEASGRVTQAKKILSKLHKEMGREPSERDLARLRREFADFNKQIIANTHG
jgi:beta-N-acetylhexosaminidase